MHEDTGLSPSAGYDYRIRATSGRCDSEFSATVTGVPILLGPTGLTATAISVSRVRLAWTDRSVDESGFEVERSVSAVSGFQAVTVLPVGTVAYEDRELAPNTAYRYRVRAAADGIWSEYSPEAAASTDQLLAITMVSILAAGDTFTTGDTVHDPIQTQGISYNY